MATPTVHPVRQAQLTVRQHRLASRPTVRVVPEPSQPDYVQLLRYKAFFNSCPGAVHRAQELTEGLSMPELRQHRTPTSTFQPGAWRGW
jgi:hypothetical protein